jgi:hypothetical protein
MADETQPGDNPPAEDPLKKYDQAFFLDLAGKGKEAWKEWRCRDPANAKVPVTFAGIDFSKAPWDEIDFSRFEFGDRANFSGCKWPGVLEDVEAFAPGRAYFIGAMFGDEPNFSSASFGNWANFDRAIFGAYTNFAGAAFGYNAASRKFRRG